jgi:hypothetical protein
MTSLLDIAFRIFAYSIFVAPFTILIIGVILYYYKPIHRLTVGIILITLGSLGVAIYPFVLYFTLINGTSNFGVILVFASVCAEVITLYFGIKSLRNKTAKSTIGYAQQNL